MNNEYGDAELKENPPASPQFDKLMRNILATNPRVTRFKVDWDDTSTKHSQCGSKIDQCMEESDSSPKVDLSTPESMDL